MVFEGIYSSRPVHLSPYLLGGFDQIHSLNADETGYTRVDDTTLDAGFDVKYGITNNLTLDLTVNTDFAQVEADDQQINRTRFNLFFPEKRQFFQERSGIFEFNTGENGRLFHSRRIGLSETGEQLRIIGGGRLTGKVGSWDIGLLNMQTGRYEDIDTENFGVLRLRREVINPYSFAGGCNGKRHARFVIIVGIQQHMEHIIPAKAVSEQCIGTDTGRIRIIGTNRGVNILIVVSDTDFCLLGRRKA